MCRGWHDISLGWYICGIDAGFFQNLKAIGVGIILQDAFCRFCHCSCILYPWLFACGRRRGDAALSSIKELRFSQVIFESGSKLVLDGLGFKTMDLSGFDTMIKVYRVIFDERPSFRIVDIRRDTDFVILYMLYGST